VRATAVRPSRSLRLGHAAYLLVTGIWPLLHRRSFEALSGHKRDYWLVETVGGLAAAGGIALAVDARSAAPAPSRTAQALALGSAATFLASDVGVVAHGHGSRAYALDALVQIGLLGLWRPRTGGSGARRRRGRGPRPRPQTGCRRPSAPCSRPPSAARALLP
jgi:hypothetical protein